MKKSWIDNYYREAAITWKILFIMYVILFNLVNRCMLFFRNLRLQTFGFVSYIMDFFRLRESRRYCCVLQTKIKTKLPAEKSKKTPQSLSVISNWSVCTAVNYWLCNLFVTLQINWYLNSDKKEWDVWREFQKFCLLNCSTPFQVWDTVTKLYWLIQIFQHRKYQIQHPENFNYILKLSR
jgi:hypothetical protein